MVGDVRLINSHLRIDPRDHQPILQLFLGRGVITGESAHSSNTTATRLNFVKWVHNCRRRMSLKLINLFTTDQFIGFFVVLFALKWTQHGDRVARPRSIFFDELVGRRRPWTNDIIFASQHQLSRRPLRRNTLYLLA